MMQSKEFPYWQISSIVTYKYIQTIVYSWRIYVNKITLNKSLDVA